MTTTCRQILLIAFVGLWLGLLSPSLSVAGDPDLVFHTIKTEHFNIHFHQGLEQNARTLATLAEEVHRDLTILFGWEVEGPTELIITDDTDAANGFAVSSPRPLIHLYATAPQLHSALAHHDHWLRSLFTHEYTHIVHIQIHSGISRLINGVFGKIYLPNSIQPRWFTEGISVLNETYETSMGRIRSSAFQMYVRTNAIEDKILGLGELSNPNRSFPRGNYPYVYGSMFLDYLARRFGRDKIIEIAHDYGASLVPYGMNRSFKRVMGIDLITLYDDWTKTLKEDSEATKARLTKKGLTTSTALTGTGEGKGPPVFSSDGKSLVVAIGDGESKSGLFRVSLDGTKISRVSLSDSRSYLSIDANDRIFFTRAAPFKNNYHFNDIFFIGAHTQEPKRLTHGLRTLQAAINPGGDKLAAVINDGGTSNLALLNEQGAVVRVLVDSAQYDQVYEPSWSPSSDKVAVVIREDDQVDLFAINPQSGARIQITDDRALESGPRFDPSGRYLLYSSDRTGISNLYTFDFHTGNTLQLTRVLTGAFAPAVSPDGSTIAFIKFSSIGSDIHLMEFAPKKAPLAERADDIEEPIIKPDPPLSTVNATPYNPLPSFLPRAWMLGLITGSDGNPALQIVASMQDAVARHQLGAELDWNFTEALTSTRLAYSYSGLGPSLFVGLNRSFTRRQDGYIVNYQQYEWVQKVLNARLGMTIPIFGLDRSHSLTLSYNVTKGEPTETPSVPRDPNAVMPRVPAQYFHAGVTLGWQFNDLQQSPFGIGPENGRTLGASVEMYLPAFGSTSTLTTFRYRWTEYMEMPWFNHHVLVTELSGGVRISNPPHTSAFSAGGFAEQNIIDTILGNAASVTPNLRGYAPGAFQGDQMYSLRLEYRMPLWFPEWAYYTLPAFFRHVQAGVFNDNMLIDFEQLSFDSWKSSVGGELIWLFYIAYGVPFTLRTGYAYGLMEGGIHEWIVRLGGSF